MSGQKQPEQDWLSKATPLCNPHAPAPEPKIGDFNPSKADNEEEGTEVEESIDVHFEPVVKLEIIETKTLEEDETRPNVENLCQPLQFSFLVFTNVVTGEMELKPNVSSDKSWVWNTSADFSDEKPTRELLAIRFATPELAKAFKKKFDEAKEINLKVQGKVKEQEAVVENKGKVINDDIRSPESIESPDTVRHPETHTHGSVSRDTNHDN